MNLAELRQHMEAVANWSDPYVELWAADVLALLDVAEAAKTLSEISEAGGVLAVKSDELWKPLDAALARLEQS